MNGADKPVLLHLIDTGGPGGAETVFLKLFTSLGARGWGGVPVISRDDWLAARLRAEGHEPVILNPKGSVNLGYLGALRRLIKGHRVAVIVTHLYGSAIYGSVAGAVTRTPVVSILHGQSDIGSGERFGLLKAEIVGRVPRKLVTVSTALREYFSTTIPAPARRWEVIPNGVDTSKVTPGQTMGLRERLRIPPGAIIVGALGNVRRPKAYDVFLRVARQLLARDSRYHFVVAGQGSGALLDELLQAREALGLARNVHFLGSVERVAAYLGDLDIFLLTSATEGFSLACVEAMACGVPVVATRCGGPEEIIVDGETGFLRPVGDVDALAAAVEQLAARPELRQRMGSAGRYRAAAEFSLAAMVARYEDVIRDLVQAGP